MKKVIAAVGIGAALIAGPLLGAGTAQAEDVCPFGTTLNPVRNLCYCPTGQYWDEDWQTCQSEGVRW